MSPVLQPNNVGEKEVSGHSFLPNDMQLAVVSQEENLTCRMLSEVTNMNIGRKSRIVVGICLTDERTLGKVVGNSEARNLILGVICIENINTNAEELRRVMCADLPCLPASFSFLTKEGWPVCKQQEALVKISHLVNEKDIICIKKQFDKQRVGIVEAGGDPIGFVFVDLNCSVQQFREVIEQQLKICSLMKLDYRFIERNGWPVMHSQETVLSLVDIILGYNACIKYCDKAGGSVSEGIQALSLNTNNNNTVILNEARTQNNPDASDGDPSRRVKSIKPSRPENHSTRRPGRGRIPSRKDCYAKPILISYVRAEAAQYALDLKKELVRFDFSVYLDVHEIKTGSDWQDDLNFAVQHCYLFVPLITPMYGKTQWTNREIKLADVLGKVIIPVNFMEQWPPACLAIQFASTQYIPWKLQEVDHVRNEIEKTLDPRFWDPVQVKRVTKQIAVCYKENYSKWSRMRKLSTKVIMENEENYYSCHPDDLQENRVHHIVISVHPKQKYLAQEVKALFEKDGHHVWCSIELQDTLEGTLSEEGNVTNPNTPRDLPPIPEGEVFFSQNDIDIYTSGETKQSLSIHKEPEAFGRRPLSRLMSQFSDISHVSILTHEKLDRLRTFQQKVDQAEVVIVMVSEAYTKSTFSHQQVFYCEHRKRVVLVKCDTSLIPKWFRLLMGNDVIMKVNNPQFECVLKARVKRALNPTTSETPKDATAEAKINCLVNFLKKNLPLQDKCVYIGGSSKLQTQRAEEICKAIGREFSKMKKFYLVTGGFYGAADITAKAFCECRGNSPLKSKDSSVVHILPIRDSEDLSSKSKQNPDGSFEAISYGKTVFLGDSVKERETVVARLLDTCIIIEGGPGAVHEIEEFIWNDHFVIPIMSTGGAAGGQYGVPVKIFELPPGVDEADWNILSDKNASPEAVAKAVVNIFVSLKRAPSSPTPTLVKMSAFQRLKSIKQLKLNKYSSYDQQTNLEQSTTSTSSTTLSHSNAMLSDFTSSETSEISQSSCDEKKKKLWQRIFKFFSVKA